jgi:DNA-binding NarL/FixJ family response regulator
MSFSEEYKREISNLVNNALTLLDDLRNNRQSLRDTVQSILAASRLEEHIGVSRFAELLNSVADGLVSGSLDPNNLGNRSSIKVALSDLKNTIDRNEETVSLNVEQELRQILKTGKADERDFVVAKVIKVLYIDEDRFAQYNIRKNIGNSIQIESCLSANEAEKKLREETFDAILCDSKLSDPHIVSIFKEYSSKIPIVAISVSDDPKLVQLATKAGAVDFIVKNDAGVKWIPRSLHTVTNEWRKRASLSSITRILENPNSKKVLKYFLDSKGPIKQEIHSNLIYDHKSDNVITDVGNVLESLVNAGYIVKRPIELVLACSRCNSVNVTQHYLCHNCKSSDFVKDAVLEHNKCGYADLEYKFRNRDALICPKCNKELKLIGVDYFKMDSAYGCRVCKNIFGTPEIRCQCNDCGLANFGISEGKWTQLHSYQVIQDKLGKIKQSIISLTSLEEFLLERGFKTDSNVNTNLKFALTSGYIDLVARREDQTILVIVLGSDVEENFTKIIELDTVAKTVPGIIYKYAVVFSELREVTRNLLKRFAVIPVLADDATKMLEKFKQAFVSESILS